ncbi:hypothetical protein PAAG_05884 [Paracoccidioides lutzii Pb01]|uniref:Major facilitator superfamily (MFS) profile domain-containing protein n=1 Tax=Paracoccidioides lutzii (strain ATCC MYA-826 / Pb01) TaxID=502779 RepID=C1H543_PARBA|nr:hypothetical protein PAAG_05884 [Paracoccidioides lutzii Pb01]EEH34837.2 hypothetical protein PAAG_05884 [Paracoccidioides lutzii Pb01]
MAGDSNGRGATSSSSSGRSEVSITKSAMAPVRNDVQSHGNHGDCDVEGQNVTEPSIGDKPSAPKKLSPPPPPPNGGYKAWLQVLGAFFLFFNSWGIINTFGVYQTYYKATYIPQQSPSAISWIGTTEGFLLFLVGVIAGPIFDKGYLRFLIVTGSFCVVFGLMMTSLSTEYYQLFLAQGVLVGIGCAFLFVPSVAIVATYFTTKRALANGITASGGSLGAVIYPIIFRKLIDKLGFGWTTRIIAFIALGCLIASIAILRSRLPPPPKTRRLLDISAVRDIPYLILSFGIFFVFVGLYFPFFYVPTDLKVRLHASDDLAFYMIAILNAGSIFGRIIPGLLADHFGALDVMIPCSFACAVLLFAWMGIHSIAGSIVFSCLYGFFSGALVSLPPTVIASLSPDLSLVGTRMGMCFWFAGLGLLIGNPIAGALLDIYSSVFWKAQLFVAVLLITGTGFLAWVRIMVAKEKGWKI